MLVLNDLDPPIDKSIYKLLPKKNCEKENGGCQTKTNLVRIGKKKAEMTKRAWRERVLYRLGVDG